jgi:mannosylglycoprotein endo-beta-mannosidase
MYIRTSAPVLVNGSPTNVFYFEKGLGQGDTLSPFLFLIAAEGLNAMIMASVQTSLFTGFSVGRDLSFRPCLD